VTPPLRVLAVVPYYPPHVGGVERYAFALHDRLLRRPEVDHVTVVAPRLPPDAPVRDGDRRHRVLRYPAVEAVPNYPLPRGLPRAIGRALRGPHDVVVSHTRFFLTSFMALGVARAIGAPLFHVEHGSAFVQLGGATGRVALGYDRTLGRALLRRADVLTAVSRAAAGFVERVSGRRADVLYTGVAEEELDGVEPNTELAARFGERPLLAFAGRLLTSKGVDDLVEALGRLERSDAVLVVVGDGPERSRLEAVAAPLGDRVAFLGALPHRETVAVLKAADLVVNPSLTEGLPTAVVEAALCRRAVVATDVGGTAEALAEGEGGVLVAPRDPAALSEALDRLLGDPEERRRLGERAREGALRRFSWDRTVERFLELVP